MADQQNIKLNFSLDFRVISILLAAIILIMLGLWRPWSATTSEDRVITVTGDTTIKAEPDEYVFYPTYEFEGTDKDKLLASMNQKSDELVSKLKELGVADSNIKTNANNYDYKPLPVESGNATTYTLQLTVTAGSRDEAQKIQDYLVTTSPSGQITPQAAFSEAKLKQLQSEARDQATKDARSKAEQSAVNLGFKIGKVKSVEDGAGFGGIYPTMDGVGRATGQEDSVSSLSVQPGENELNYSVTVTYYLK